MTEAVTQAEVVTLGEALVAYRSHGRLGFADRISASAAGAEMNVAVGLARLGHDAAWIGVLGEDPPGDLIARTLRAEGVDISAVRRDAGAPTAVMLVDQPPALSAVVTYHRRDSAGSRVGVADVERAGLSGARILHLSGITPALSDSAHDAFVAALASARENGVIVSIDVNYRAKLWSRDTARAVLTGLARQADLVIASEDELDLVSAAGSERGRIDDLLGATPREVIVKRGRHGAEVFAPGRAVASPAFPVTEVNSIGAGDAFTAGYLSGLLDDLTTEARLRRAAACGAFAVAGDGDWEQAPTKSDLDRFLGAADTAR